MQMCSVVLWCNNIVTIKPKGNLMIIHLLLLLSFLIFNVQTTEQQPDSSSKQTHPRVDLNEVQSFQQNKTIGSRSRHQFLIATKRVVQRKKQKHNYNRVQQTSEEKTNEVNLMPDEISYPNDTSLHASRNQSESFINVLFRRLRMEKPPNISALPFVGMSEADILIMQLFSSDRLLQRDGNDDHKHTIESVAISGQLLSNHSCEKRLKKSGYSSNSIECYRFLDQSYIKKLQLPRRPSIKSISLIMKKEYFNLDNNNNQTFNPVMFRVYMIYRPLVNNSKKSSKLTSKIPSVLKLPVTQVKQILDSYELVFDDKKMHYKTIYDNLMSELYDVAISKNLQDSYARQYSSPFSPNSEQRKQDDDGINNNSKQERSTNEEFVPYFDVEYGETENNGYRSHDALSRNKCSSSSPCCRRPLTLHFDDSHLLNFIVYPRVLDIGECVGLCDLSSVNQLQIRNSSQYNSSSIKEHYSSVNGRCCSFSRTSGLELLFREKQSIRRQFVPQMIIETCRCSSGSI
ncbi:unnamed protein product, partial [Didymodactylos carnosus]